MMEFIDEFDKEEFDNKDNYNYYFDIDNKSLHKRTIDGKDSYDFVLGETYDGGLFKDWNETKSLDSANLYKIEDFDIVLRYINDFCDDIINGRYEVDLKKYVDDIPEE